MKNGKVDSRAEWDGFYLLRWLLQEANQHALLNPEKAQQKRVKAGSENGAWSGGESDKDLYKKKLPLSPQLMIQQSDYPYFPARNERVSLWRNGGEEIFKEIQVS